MAKEVFLFKLNASIVLKQTMWRFITIRDKTELSNFTFKSNAHVLIFKVER